MPPRSKVISRERHAPGQSQIASLAGVSRSTVAWALHPTRRHKLRPETLRRVQKAVEQLHYRPNRYAQIMRRGKSGILGLLRFAGFSQMRAELEYNVVQRIRAGGYKSMVAGSIPTPDVGAACEELLDTQVEGVIIEGPNSSQTQDVVERFRGAGIPFVILSGSEMPGTIHVRSDMRVGMREITSHLLRLGRKRLVLILKGVDPRTYRYDWWRNYDKLLGFSDAIREAKGTLLDSDGQLAGLAQLNPEVSTFTGSSEVQAEVFLDPGDANWFDPHHEGMRAAERVFRRKSKPDALVCTNDDWAIGAIHACRNASIEVPRDIAVTGFDNCSVGQYLSVPLTSASQAVEEKADTAVRILMEITKGSRSAATELVIKVPSHAVVRESCGARLSPR